ncbi:MAG: DUF1638 domain-containing protein [Sedimentisphaerales bacterium]|nr:DUF1638 domain-containing protein [Sedimentisphaerales bacterium]
MRLQFIVCKVMQREAYYCAARSPNVVDVVAVKQGLHNEPAIMRGEVQKHLDATSDADGRQYDAQLLGYGLCSNGTVGLHSEIPLVVPRGHDCVTLLLGSKDKYRDYFESHKGVYWFSPGWIETNMQPGKERFERTLNQYIQKYGKDNAGFLMEREQNWLKEYRWATYIDWGFANSLTEKEYTKRAAEYLGWTYDLVKGDSGLMQRLVDGKWDVREFLIVKPGQKIIEDLTNEGIIKAE